MDFNFGFKTLLILYFRFPDWSYFVFWCIMELRAAREGSEKFLRAASEASTKFLRVASERSERENFKGCKRANEHFHNASERTRSKRNCDAGN